MPKWRKLWTKATESRDINEMPDDTVRLGWLLLPVALDREGRAVDNPAWLKAKLFPMRLDLDYAAVAAMLDWWEARGMIERYEAGGGAYFWVPSFAAHQGDTSREAESLYPAPPSQVESGSGRGMDRVESRSRVEADPVGGNSGSDTDADTDTDKDADADTDTEGQPVAASGTVAELLTGFGVGWTADLEREFGGLTLPVVEGWIGYVENRRPPPDNPAGLLITCLRSGRAPPGMVLSIEEQERRRIEALKRSAVRWGFDT